MDFSGFKAKSINLITNGKGHEARQALTILGFSEEEADLFIKEVKIEKVQYELSGDRVAYLKSIVDGLSTVFTDLTDADITKLERLTEGWTRMPTFTVSLQRRVEVDPESRVEHVIFSWNKTPKFSGASAPRTASTESNGDRAKTITPPEPYKSWSDVVTAMIPQVINDYVAKHGSNSGFNARRAVRDAIKAGTISLAGFTAEMLDY